MSRGGLSAAVLVSSVSLTALCSSPALAQSYWQGNVSGDWNNILNWSDLLVPSAATTVVIADGSNYSATISSYAATANILRVGGFVGSSLLQVNLGGSLVASSTQIGNDALEVGSVGVDGAGATWNSQFLDVGRYGTGTFTLSGGRIGHV